MGYTRDTLELTDGKAKLVESYLSGALQITGTSNLIAVVDGIICRNPSDFVAVEADWTPLRILNGPAIYTIEPLPSLIRVRTLQGSLTRAMMTADADAGTFSTMQTGEIDAALARVSTVQAQLEGSVKPYVTRAQLESGTHNPGTATRIEDEFGTLNVVPNDGTPVDKAYTFAIASNLLAKRKQLANGWIDAELFKIDTSGVKDESVLLQGLVDDAIVRLPIADDRAGKGIRISTGIQIGTLGGLWGADHVHGRGVLLAQRTDGGAVIELSEIRDVYVGHRANGEGQADTLYKMAVQDITVKGTGKAQNAVGMRLRNSTQRFSHLTVKSIGKGVVFHPFSDYLNELEYLVVSNCGVGVEFPSAAGGNQNSGENLGFYKPFIIGNDIGLVIEDGWSIRMASLSLDYNTNQIRFVGTDPAASPHLHLFAPHIEWDSGTPFLMNNFGNRGGNVIGYGGVYLNLGNRTRSEASIIDPGCGPGHLVILHNVEDGERVTLSAANGLPNLGLYSQGTVAYNNSGVRWIVYVTATHNPTAAAASSVRFYAGNTNNPPQLSESSRPANHIPGVKETLTFTVEPGQYFKVSADNATVSLARVLTP